jgi:hypothetical protein
MQQFEHKLLKTLCRNIKQIHEHYNQGLQEKFCRRNKTALGPRVYTVTSLKIEDLRSHKTTGKLSLMLYFLKMAFLITM